MHWADKIEKKIQRLETDGPTNFHMQTILRWYGFMGAFDDIYICQSNGHDVTEEETYDVNVKLDKFIKTIHAEATRLK